ncbi:hypothetical protein FCU45_09400 [Sulfurimonas crateris]|uniref:DUF3568 family protein n=1 Tax=Sulfurimonas crateris TaxID=2574727 RepID=A0A4U2Z6X1_9BACT|nr:hypothetical protein [Sulfurimonas crateris]TKI68631.1 hypothetical protein FCU45_09400 [Sulfurimonas crateris]
MKKMFSIVVVSAVTLILSVGCSGGLEMGAKGPEAISENAIYVGHHSNENVLEAIKIAGVKEGWRVTEFKSNAVIVEKIIGDKTVSSTVVYENEQIAGDNKNAPMDELLKLRQAIVDELKKEGLDH